MAKILSGTGLVNLEPNAPGQTLPANELLELHDYAWGAIRVLDRNLSAPPGGESDGDIYIVATTPTGDWSTFTENDLAVFLNGAYIAVTPQSGWKVFIVDELLTVTFAPSGSWRSGSALDADIGLTASINGVQGDIPLDPAGGVHVFTTVGNLGGATLPLAEFAGRHIYVVNDGGANTLNLFPAAGDEIDNLGANVADTIITNATSEYIAVEATRWFRWHR